MLLSRLAFALSLLFAAASPSHAQLVKYFGQDDTAPPQGGPFLSATAGPAVARSAFVGNLDVGTVTTAGFEGLAAVATPPIAGTLSLPLLFNNGAGLPVVTVTATADVGAVVNNPLPLPLGAGDPQDGLFAAGGDQYLYVYACVTLDISAPVHALGLYLADLESAARVRLVLRRDGTTTRDTLRYGPIFNADGQLTFVGAINKGQGYDQAEICVEGGLEGFAIDDIVIADAAQVLAEQATVAEAAISDAPGWRLLAPPLYDVTIDMIALQNLIQGVPGGGGVQQQYPLIGSNVYTGYGGGGRWDYVPAASTDQELVPGRGVWWYWYDRDLDPDDAAAGGGTSESISLDGFALSAVGQELLADTTVVFDDNDDCASSGVGCGPGQSPNADPTTVGAPPGTVSPADDDFYLVGNPYPRPMAVAAITATGGALTDAKYIWNPTNAAGSSPSDGPNPPANGPGSYEVVYTTPPDAVPDSIAVWQGLLAEVTAPVGGTVSFSYARVGSLGSGAPPFYGKRAAEPHVAFELFGVLDSGAETRDAAATVRWRDDAELGPDRYDATKPVPPTAAYGLLAPMAERDGEPWRLGVLALPTGASGRVPLALATSGAGAFRLTWEAHGLDGWLVDLETGAHAPLSAGELAFEAGASEWHERFELVAAPAVASERLPAGVAVGEPWPNPAADAVAVDVRLGRAADVRVRVYDALGRELVRLDRAVGADGEAVRLDTRGLAAGTYAVVVEAPGLRETRRLTVVR